jgi:hypothetical protein
MRSEPGDRDRDHWGGALSGLSLATPRGSSKVPASLRRVRRRPPRADLARCRNARLFSGVGGRPWFPVEQRPRCGLEGVLCGGRGQTDDRLPTPDSVTGCAEGVRGKAPVFRLRHRQPGLPGVSRAHGRRIDLGGGIVPAASVAGSFPRVRTPEGAGPRAGAERPGR